MSIRALKEYLEAREALRQGQAETAAQHLEQAVRSSKDNRMIRGNLGTLLDHKSLAGGAVLEVLRVEVQRRG